MKNNIDIKEVRKLLPHGAITQIARKAGVHTPTVSRALHGDKRSSKLPEIIKATAQVLSEHKAKEREAMEAISEAMNPANKKAVNP